MFEIGDYVVNATNGICQIKEVVKMDLPFVRERWSREKAIDYFRSEGELDKMRLLVYRPYDFCCFHSIFSLYVLNFK